jgi:lipid-A-disaccharide synthase
MDDKKIQVFISACEASADIHCAKLIKAVKSKNPDIEFIGIGGDNMKQAGCLLLENTVSRAAMLHKALAEIGYFYKIFKRIKQYLKENPVKLVIVCDSPSFNFHVAKLAKKIGIKTFFYVAPQLWAWAPWRIKKLKKCCDKLACILPFEEQWFNSRGANATFIGNPLFAGQYERIRLSAKLYENFNAKNAKIALIPGSRRHEIESIWPAMQKIAMKLKRKYKNITFTAVAFNEKTKNTLKNTRIPGFDCQYSVATVIDTARNSDFALVTSGSACLEVASAGCPMAILYQGNKFLWHLIGRWLILTKYLSLVNILAGKKLVPEFMPYFDSIEPIYDAACKLLDKPAEMKQLSASLVALTSPLAEKNAELEAARLIDEMVS